MKFWNGLSAAAKAGFVAGLLVIVVAVAGAAWWLLGTEYETVVRSSSPEKIAVAVREIERLKIPYRVADDGASVSVPREEVGRIKVGIAENGGTSGVGFELFNNTDFSTTEFTQKINYQRALQGELARTISAIEGVASARVHLVLPESGFLRRQTVRPTAAINVLMEAGAQLSSFQVQGIQRLVAASVPDIKLDDIAVIDQDGIALTRTKSGTDDTASQGRLELKREVDAYLEGKLKRILANIDPVGDFSVSVDATLNLDDVKVTTEDVIPVDNGAGVRSGTGVLVRERQSQRRDGSVADAATGGASAPQSASTTREVEYKVGHRVEQVATAPGGIQRVSVAVLARSAKGEADEARIKDLVVHAIGADLDRGDSVAVVVLPALPQSEAPHASGAAALPSAHGDRPFVAAQPSEHHSPVRALAWLLGLGVFALLGWVALRRSRADADQASEVNNLSDAQVDQIVARVNTWLAEGQPHGTV